MIINNWFKFLKPTLVLQEESSSRIYDIGSYEIKAHSIGLWNDLDPRDGCTRFEERVTTVANPDYIYATPIRLSSWRKMKSHWCEIKIAEKVTSNILFSFIKITSNIEIVKREHYLLTWRRFEDPAAGIASEIIQRITRGFDVTSIIAPDM